MSTSLLIRNSLLSAKFLPALVSVLFLRPVLIPVMNRLRLVFLLLRRWRILLLLLRLLLISRLLLRLLLLNLLPMRSNVHDRRSEAFPHSYYPIHFKESEFQSCDPPCSFLDMDDDFLRKLDKLRELCDFPLLLTCAYRSCEHDKSRGRDGSSFHCAGRAVDIYCTTSDKRFSLLLHAPMVGLNGIGVGKTFIHVDDRNVPAAWSY